MRYVIEYETRLTFPQPVREHHCELRLVPSDISTQRVQRVAVSVEPPAELNSYIDYFGNTVQRLSVIAPHSHLLIHLHAEVETLLRNPLDYAVVPAARELAWVADRLKAQPRLWDYVLYHSPAIPNLQRCAAPPDCEWPTHDAERQLLDSVLAAASWITSTFAYEWGIADTPSPFEHFLKARAGDCIDLAHLLVAVVRWWGFPARYVTGYQDPGYASDDASEVTHQRPHAWAEVLIPGAGWRGFDPRTRLVVNDTYVVVAVGRDAHDAAPMRATYTGTDSGETEVALRVTPQPDQTQ